MPRARCYSASGDAEMARWRGSTGGGGSCSGGRMLLFLMLSITLMTIILILFNDARAQVDRRRREPLRRAAFTLQAALFLIFLII